MRKKLYVLLLTCGLMLSALSAQAQLRTGDKVKWTMSVEMLSPAEAVVTLKATPKRGWHLYGTQLPKGGPKPTTIVFDDSDGIALVGGLVASEAPTSVEDPMFDMTITWWQHTVSFAQRIRLTDPKNAKVVANITFMACNDVTCTPPTTIKLTQSLN